MDDTGRLLIWDTEPSQTRVYSDAGDLVEIESGTTQVQCQLPGSGRFWVLDLGGVLTRVTTCSVDAKHPDGFDYGPDIQLDSESEPRYSRLTLLHQHVPDRISRLVLKKLYGDNPLLKVKSTDRRSSATAAGLT